MTDAGRRIPAAVAFVAAAAFSCPVLALPRQPGGARAALLDVPYVPQSELLCGGAAAAMVMRYWGARDVYATAFAPLVDRGAGGITTDALVADLQGRSWSAAAGSGSAADAQRELARGRPVIALVDVGRGRFHYIVLLAWTASSVVLHDPARTPFRAVNPRSFDEAWRKSGRWMLVLLPPAGGVAVTGDGGRPDPKVVNPDLTPPCGVGDGVAAAERGDRATARRLLETAAAACPDAPAAWRELAGVDALDARWTDAAAHARRALAADPNDEYALRTLATAEYVQHHDLDALNAWNRIGEPRLDLVEVGGLTRTRYDVAQHAIGMTPGTLVTPAALDRAERRLRDVPALAAARVSFHPVANGRAQIDAAVVERDVAPLSYPAWIAIGLRAAAEREAGAAFASVTGGGELASITWRWWTHRPAVEASFSAPAPDVIGGTWRVEAMRETQTFGLVPFEQTRVHAGLFLGQWLTSTVRVEGGTGVDTWVRGPRTGSLSGGVEFRSPAGAVDLEARASAFVGSSTSFGTTGVSARWRSRPPSAGRVWLAGAGLRDATNAAPASLWPGADTGHARDVLLRAHPLLSDGIIEGGVFGRRLIYANAEAQQWIRSAKWPVSFAPAAFVDTARASRGFASTDDRAHVDAGLGLRVSIAGAGVLRIDAAHGLRDGRNALSIGWSR